MKIYAFADEVSSQIDRQIVAMRQNSLDGLEIRNVDGVNVSLLSDAKAKEVRKKLDDAGFCVWSIGSPIGKIDIEKDNFAAHLEKFKRTMEIADILGAKNIRLFSFFTPAETRDSFRDEVIERLGEFVRLAQGSGITLCHENEKGIYGDLPERCLEIHKALPSLRAVFDPANFVQCGADTLKGWLMLKPYVEYLHIKDALTDGRVVPAGKGEGNLREILEDYLDNGGNCVTVEPHLNVFDGLAELEKLKTSDTVGTTYRYPTSTMAFAVAVTALRDILDVL